MKERNRQKIKMLIMIALTFLFFLVEIIVGYMTESLALISDSFHMISDVMSLIIGFACLWLSTKESKTNTYGWARTEIIGALINSVFLIALCFSIFVEAIQRMFEPDTIRNPDLLLIVGSVGLGVNLFGLLLFCNETVGHHGHSHGGDEGHTHGDEGHTHGHEGHSHGHEGHAHGHGGHSHGHGGHAHTHKGNSHEKQNDDFQCNGSVPVLPMMMEERHSEDTGNGSQQVPPENYFVINAGNEQTMSHSVEIGSQSKPCCDIIGDCNGGFISDDVASNVITTAPTVMVKQLNRDETENSIKKDKNKKIKTGGQMNIQGVFLHILGDALGSVVVIISALLIKYCEGNWVSRVDPALSLLMVLIILSSTIPLFKQSALILLQNVPKNLNVDNLIEKMKTEVTGLSNVHDLHVWQLVGSRVIASMHMRCRNFSEYVETSKKIKTFFHENGIHSTTIQPEFLEQKDKPTNRECYLECGPDLQCFVDTCCSIKTNPGSPEIMADQPTVFTSLGQSVAISGIGFLEERF